MTYEEAKAQLIEGYAALNISFVSEADGSVCFQRGNREYSLSGDRIRLYAENLSQAHEYEAKPNRCSIVSNSYREQAIQPLNLLQFRPHVFRDGRRFTFGESSSANLRVEISAPSSRFTDHFRFDEGYIETTRLHFPILRDRPMDLGDLTARYPTIKVFNLDAPTRETALTTSQQMIEACLFELTYLKDMTFGLLQDWPQRRRESAFRMNSLHTGAELPLPRAAFNPDLIQFYQLGAGTEISILQFLAFYQVLEYHFVSVSDEALYARVRPQLNDPDFKQTTPQLDRLIQTVLDHKRTSDETEMLKRVLERYVDEVDLIDFIRQYEESIGEKLYTKRRSRFGQDAEIKTNAGHVFGNTAKIIKIVRNALVHSSDWHERSERHVPFSKESETVEKEVPLMRYLAERVIIRSASTLQ